MMKIKLIITVLLPFVFVSVSSAQIPEVNKSIIKYVNSVIGFKVNRGECWDLAKEALEQNNCDWDGGYKFGKKINPKTDSIFPGDIIQFSGVKLKFIKDGLLYNENYNHHTAIIYCVKGKNIFKIAHQNNAFSGKKVGISEINLDNKKSGTIDFFRPVVKN
ncbi:MAG: hypothetical protein PHR81_00780 [Bacteroidales bacterium]|nr:hypothetical protein [Bacteroidales bacterium]MDD4213323.1 hypothetical protein [Bacteroidales bacterium]